jgi:hypothetical protein
LPAPLAYATWLPSGETLKLLPFCPASAIDCSEARVFEARSKA